MSISKKDLEVLVKEFPSVERRNPDWGDNPQLPIELDSSFIDKNEEAAIWLLENSDLIIQALSTFYEGERPSE